jgi:hypothetical protein
MDLGDRNIGDIDRAVRLIVAAALVYAIGVGMVVPPLSYLVGLLMLVLLFTVAAGTCWLYTLLGISTCPVKPRAAAKAAPARKAKRAKKKGRRKS